LCDVQEGHESTVVLARLGAGVNVPAHNEVTTTQVAAQKGHVTTEKTLLRLGAHATKAWRRWTDIYGHRCSEGTHSNGTGI